jgi:CRP/FNR family transcriptional regulator, cyclic AMP receptor protein
MATRICFCPELHQVPIRLHQGSTMFWSIPDCDTHPGLWRAVSELLITRKRELEKKIELLCLQDVEYRILYYLAELSNRFGVKNGPEVSVPLSQGELGSLIGATRETTSTTLNTLARRGLIRLGRRQLILTSVDEVVNAAKERSAKAVAS